MGASGKQGATTRNRIVFVVVVLVWIVLDRITKQNAEVLLQSTSPAPSVAPLVTFGLVHNEGAAWGSFSGMVDAIIIVTVILCAAIAFYAIFASKSASVLEMVGLALIFAGGIGNLIDRIFSGYVIDFIEFLFIDFPTFNVADIGITCGIVCVLVSFLLRSFEASWRRGDT